MRLQIATRKAFFTLFVFATTLLLFGRPSYAQFPRIVSADVVTDTGGQEKDHDTGIWVDVIAKDNRLIAKAENAAYSKDDNRDTHFKDHSHHEFPLTIVDPNIPIPDAQGFRVKFRIKANGNNHWIADVKIRLHYSDGVTVIENARHVDLNSRGSDLVGVEF
jgi:hypothetical protein